jgi:hypothetical protein
MRTVALCAILAAEALILCLPGIWWGVAGLSLLVLALLLGLLLAVLCGRGERIILSWILVFPLGYYYFSFPREHSLITLDRIFIGILLGSACFAIHPGIPRIPRSLRMSGAYWGLFLLFAAMAIPRAKTPLVSLRLWVEAFLFPALLAWYVLRYFEVRRHLSAMHALTCVMAIYAASIGIAEVFLQQDLLPLPSGGFVVAGDYTDLANILPRPNGPFATNNSFAMIGIVSLFFLLFLKRTLVGQMAAWQRILHRIGVAAALAETLMPLFKSVLFSLATVLLADVFYQHGRRRVVRVGAVLSLGFAFLSLQLVLPSVFEERADSTTFYARIAQEKQTMALFMDHPINGVGLSNFEEAAQNSKYSTFYKTGGALDSPHNNFGAILAETGLTGFVPFVVAQVLLVSAFWKLRQANTDDSKLVWKAFLFLFLCYWINGISLTIIYFEDLNLWYLFALAALYKFAISSPESRNSQHFGFET